MKKIYWMFFLGPFFSGLPVGSHSSFLDIKPPSGRFQKSAPLYYIPAVELDQHGSYTGVAQQIARDKNLQARIFWIDATANLEAVGSEVKIHELVQKIKTTGFNTIVYDVKPIVGETVYPSQHAKKIEEWKNQKLPLHFDPLKHMALEAKKQGIPLLLSLNAFSEGHMLFTKGPGYDRPDLQTVLYDPSPTLKVVWPKEVEFQIVSDTEKLSSFELTYIKNLKQIEQHEAGAVYALINKNYRVEDIFESKESVIQIPEQGCLLCGIGEAASFLKIHLRKGDRIEIGSKPIFVPISQRPKSQYPLMMNPHKQEVRDHIKKILAEVLSKYDPDGIVFDDRLRFGGLNSDFSEFARAEFEHYVGKKLSWPKDVFEHTFDLSLKKGIAPGPYWDAWWTWRAMQMRRWVIELKNTVKKARPNAYFGVYAGSWYGDYSRYGINYGSTRLQAGFPFLTQSYRKTGLASDIDFLITGCYYSIPTLYAAMQSASPLGHTVEAAAMLSNEVVRDQTWVYSGLMLASYFSDPKVLEAALQAAAHRTQGIMIFDLSHKIENFWPILERAFSKQPAGIPHADPKLTQHIRQLRAKRDREGVRDPVMPFYEGAVGAGF